MTTIDKLLIQGVRSFSPTERSVIHFFTPLTLIVGQNGAGKTTVIECLKYACTGETPPNAGKSGQGFIHDPKIAREREIKAQVRLRFLTVCGKPVVVTRSMSLTQKSGSKQEFKTLESAVQTFNERNEKVSHSQRCVDVDRFIPELMGVSKAVLESVIFCHQEESNWPLGEALKVKQRFDDIFAATRYTKALDVVKKLRRDHLQTLRELKLKLETALQIKTQADKLRISLSQRETTIQAHSKNVEALSQQISAMEEHLKVLKEKRKAVSAQLTKIIELKARRDQLFVAFKRLSEQLKSSDINCGQQQQQQQQEFVGEDEELFRQVEKLQRELKGVENDSSSLIRKQKELENTRRTMQQRNQQLIDELAKIQADSKHLEEQRKVRAKMFCAFVVHYKIGGQQTTNSLQQQQQQQQHSPSSSSSSPPPPPYPPISQFNGITSSNGEESDSTAKAILSKADEILSTIESKIREMQAETMTAATEREAKIAELSKEQNLVLERISQRQVEKETTTKKISEQKMEIERNQQTREMISGVLAELQEQEQELEEARKRERSETSRNEAEITKAVEEKRKAESEMTILGEVMKKLGMQADARAKLEIARETRERCERAFENTLRNPEIQSATSTILLLPLDGETDANISKWTEITQKHQKEKETAEMIANEARDKANRKASELSGKVSTATETVENREREAEEVERKLKVEEGISTQKDLEEMIQEAETKLIRARHNSSLTASAETLYRRFISLAEETKHCPLCERGFSEESGEFESFLSKLRDVTAALPGAGSTEKKKAEVEAAERRVEKVRQLQTNWNHLQRMKTKEIPELKETKNKIAKEYSTAMITTEELSERAKQASNETNKANALCVAVREVMMKRRDFEEAKAKEQKAEERLSQESTDPRSMTEVKELYEKAQNTATKLSRKIDEMREQMNQTMKELAARERKCQILREKATNVGKLDETIARSRTSLGEMESRVTMISQELEKLKTQAPEIETRLREAKQKSKEEKAQALSQEQEKRKERDLFNTSLIKAQETHNNVIRFAREVSPGISKLGELYRQKTEIERELENLTKEIAEATKRVEGAKDATAQKELQMKYLQDNIRMRELKAEITATEEEITKLEQTTTTASESIDKDIYKAESEMNRTKEKRDKAAGAREELETQANRDRAELERPMMKNANEEHRAAMIAMETTDLAQSDLEKYYRALDNALMRYHAAKMEDINRLLREMWQSTYKGEDIEAIEIKSDMEQQQQQQQQTETGAATATATTTSSTTMIAARNYHYRVVMIKGGGVELDMRGRCSAGQKVLASLVIRLALAETFCLNCGILALDEPTANLDRKNVEGFANALAALVETRKSQRGFQLVVITHDEDFVGLLGRGRFSDYFYRVKKDQHQNSVIERHDIREIS